ncbi:MAG: T9SS C-terminal target domain-containing protein [Chlorobiota bacterium]|nr:MAG: T9SS C-terminal target domain-containing protein [Chlorobiota bacterium]
MQPADYRTQMTNALKDIRTKGAVDGYYMLLLHDPFTRPGYQNGLVVTWIGELLDSLNIEYAGKIRYRTLTEAARAFRDAPSHLAGEPESVPDGFILKQNFPNPFNPSTVIEFSTPSGGNASLKVYDVLGRAVATLLDGLVDAGSHSLRFDANGLGSGIYFYRLTINGSTLSRKMQLSK